MAAPGKKSFWENLQGDWDSAVAEFGTDMSGHWIGDWMERHNLQDMILRPGFTGFVSKLVAKSPTELRAPFFFALRNLVEHWDGPQNLPAPAHAMITTAKFTLASFLGQVPDVIDDKIKHGEIDPSNIELDLRDYLNTAWNDFSDFFNTSPAAKAARVGDLMASAAAAHGGDTAKKHVTPAADPRAAASAAAAVEELRQKREREEAARARMVAMTPAQRTSHGLYQRIINLYFRRDTGPAPHNVFTVNRLLRHLKYCEASIAALPTEIPNLAGVRDSISALELNQRRLDDQPIVPAASTTGTAPAAPATPRPVLLTEAEIEEHEAVIQAALTLFDDFEAALRSEALPLLGGFENAGIWARDQINNWSTPRTRATWRNRFRSVQQSWAWPIIAFVLMAIGFFLFAILPAVGGVVTLVATITTVMSVVGIGSGILLWALPEPLHALVDYLSMGYMDLGTISAWIVNSSAIGLVVSRVIITVGDRALEAIRALGDFLDPTDGTGVIGGSFGELGNTLRWWGAMKPKTSEQIAAEIKRREGRDNVTIVKGIITTITVAAAVVVLLMNALYLGYKDLTVTPAMAICLVIIVYFEAEFFTRARSIVTALDFLRLVNSEERRKMALSVIWFSSAGAMVTTTAVLIALLMFGPRNADNALTVSQAFGGKLVQVSANALDEELPLTPKQCAAGLATMEADAKAEGMTVDEVCELLVNNEVCACPR